MLLLDALVMVWYGAKLILFWEVWIKIFAGEMVWCLMCNKLKDFNFFLKKLELAWWYFNMLYENIFAYYSISIFWISILWCDFVAKLSYGCCWIEENLIILSLHHFCYFGLIYKHFFFFINMYENILHIIQF